MSELIKSYLIPSRSKVLELTESMPLSDLIASAGVLRDHAKGDVVSYSRKAFIPLTMLCRDVCHYCTYAKTPPPAPHALSRGLVLVRDRYS